MSWEGLFDCPCYMFSIIPSTQNIKVELDHTYKLTVKIKKPDNTFMDAMSFEKHIDMGTEVEHILTDYAAVYTGQIDTFISSAMPPSFGEWTTELIPWAQVMGYHGTVDSLEATFINDQATMTESSLDSKWNGTLNEYINSQYPTLDFANINANAYHMAVDTQDVKASSTSAFPVGWAELATDAGWSVKWIDYVGFFNHQVEKTTKTNSKTYIQSVNLDSESTPEENIVSYRVLGSIHDLGGDLRQGDAYWQPVYEDVTDPSWDGRELGWSHWMVENIINSRWSFLRDEVMLVVDGADTVSISNIIRNLDRIGDWKGSIAKSKKTQDVYYILASSDTLDTVLYKVENGAISIAETPSGLEDKTYTICPL